ncbi:MAG: SGNH/GDSL hydrolase family protein [Candidatus Aminicenantales bacterium]
MKIIRNLLFFLFAGAAVLFLRGSAKDAELIGHSFSSQMDSRGNIWVIYKNEQEGMSLASARFKEPKFQVHNVSPHPDNNSPIIRRNRKGEMAVVWIAASETKSEIYFGIIRENQLVDCRSVFQSKDFLFSLDLSFDQEDNPWLAWIQNVDERFYVVVANLSGPHRWCVNDPFITSAQRPRLLVGGDNAIWIFWVGQKQGRDEILYSLWKGNHWSFPERIHSLGRFPHLWPNAAVDQDGLPWVVWSAYDGHDYEIYYSRWNGRNWSKEEALTLNEKMDSYPSLVFILDAIPLVVWSRYDGRKSSLCYRFKSNGQWSPETEFFATDERLNRFPEIAVLNDRIAICWESGPTIESAFFFFSDLKGKARPEWTPQASGFSGSPDLDEDKYVGFGDSITYGYLDFEPAPDKGYIHRLEVLLIQAFGHAQVINEGIPGELTQEGLARIERVIARHLARYLMLMEGTNDVTFTNISMDTAAFHLEEMNRICLEFGVLPLLATVIPRKGSRWLASDQYRTFDLNDRIHSLAAKLKIPLVDQFNAFYNYLGEGEWTSLISSDDLHPSEKGYQVMAETWYDEMILLPFPPVNVRVQRTEDRTLFSKRACNVLTWRQNPKIIKWDKILAYKIYRRIRSGTESSFALLATCPVFFRKAEQKYIDTAIIPSYHYDYFISTLRNDGVEGSPSAIVYD